MSYKSLGLAGLVVAAIRAAVTDPEVAENARVAREGFDALTGRVEALTEELAGNESLDEEQRAELEGINTELKALADALTGPADDETDNGLAGEVEPADDAEPSPAADAVVDA